jgi:hypothetical protein
MAADKPAGVGLEDDGVGREAGSSAWDLCEWQRAGRIEIFDVVA